MAITNKLQFTKSQRQAFAKLFKAARLKAQKTQLEVAREAFAYTVSHCKVSRIERVAMPKVDAHCLELMAAALKIPRSELLNIDPQFNERAAVVRQATRYGFWDVRAA